jgi:hypothetical protein
VPRLILLLAVIAVIYILLRRAQSMPPHKRRAEYIKLGLGIAVVVVIGLTLTGRMHWIGAALTGLLVGARQLLPTLIRLFPMLASLRSKGATGPGAGQTSTVVTDILRMRLDHDSGALSGEVLKGSYREWLLEEMNREQLRELYSYCQSQDPDSVQLLDSYLQQRFPNEAPFGDDDVAGPPPSDSTGMSRDEALAVLGLGSDASDEDIVTAHRKLMQKLHPDRGGNDYLAAKVNQAKDLLLG